MITGKDFDMLARVIRDFDSGLFHRLDPANKVLREAIAEDFAIALSRDNPKFDRGRWMAACRAHDE